MAITTTAIGTSTPPITTTVERGTLRLFAKATGQVDPACTEVAVARAQGHRDLPVPPTFFFGLEFDQPEPFRWITDLGVDMNTVLHGSQAFEYHAMAYAGDVLVTRSTVTDVYDKKGGALQFVERRTEVTRDDEAIASFTQTIVIRNRVAA